MLLGLWKNIEDLEASISLDELHAIIDAARERRYHEMKFAAGLKGISLDDDEEEAETGEEALERLKRRAEARLSGKTEEEIENEVTRSTFADFGLDIEVEE